MGRPHALQSEDRPASWSANPYFFPHGQTNRIMACLDSTWLTDVPAYPNRGCRVEVVMLSDGNMAVGLGYSV
jgi:hypothetical protein